MPDVKPPRVLILSGLDPSGGAGLAADLLTIAAHGAHPLPVATALTVQDTHNARRVEAVAPELVREQLDCLLADGAVAALKIGLLPSAALVAVVADLLATLRVPTVLDPVLHAGGGHALNDDATAAAIAGQLLGLVTLATPNREEARVLFGLPPGTPLERVAEAWHRAGCERLLITGGDAEQPEAVNHWCVAGRAPEAIAWPRLPGGFRGAGCTLASNIAARLALGEPPERAQRLAQADTHRALGAAYRAGRGRRIPARLASHAPPPAG